MPDLSGQDGTFECIKSRDFLIASVTQAFGDNGVVDFTANPFRHFSSLLKLTISPNGDLSDTKLTKIQITGEDITSRTTYSFLSETTQVVFKSNDWTIALNDEMSEKEAVYYALLNPVTCSSGVTLLIEYEREGEFYVATKEGFASNAFSGGVMQEFTIVVKDGVLTISGAGISEWGEGAKLDDLIINGEKQEE